MAKKSSKSDRQAVIDEIRKKQKGAEKRRGYAIVGVCSLVALLIVVAAAYRPVKNWWDLRQFKDIDLASIGAPASVCDKVTTKPADGNQQHVPARTAGHLHDRAAGVRLALERAGRRPPRRSTGSSTPTNDRPELEALVHNLEHGYTILWYDDSIADDGDELTVIDGIADKFRSDSDNLRYKFIAAPWTSDGREGERQVPRRHARRVLALVGRRLRRERHRPSRSASSSTAAQPSGEALKDFMLKYPYTDSPEPDAM